MIYFLTSSSCTPGQPSLNPANGFVETLKQALKEPVHALFITSAPDDAVFTDSVAASTRENFGNSGIEFDTYHQLDRRNMEKAAADLDFQAAAKYRDEMWVLQQYLKVWKS